MKKAIKFLAVLGAGSLLLGFCVSAVEKRIKDTGREKAAEKHSPFGFYEVHLKRPLDFAAAFLGLLFLSPILAILSILVRVRLGKPVIFKQGRPGKNGKIFTLYKFRTMTDERDESGQLLSDDRRLTAFGKMLRSTSLEGNDIIRQTTKSLENKGFREVSPIIFFNGCNQFSKDFRTMIA